MGAFEGLKLLQKAAAAVTAGTLEAIGGAAVAVTMAAKHTLDEQDNELLRKTEETEACPHIHLVDGWANPFANMLGQLNRQGGIAWKNGDGNGKWYYHEQESFRPLLFTEAYQSTSILRVPASEAGKGSCQQCDTVRKRRR